MFERPQSTLRHSVSLSGVGLHTGEGVTMTLLPRPVGSGIYFERTDLPHSPRIPATVHYLQDTSRSTILGVGEVRVHTVEHLLAALFAAEIDNLCIQLSGPEPPVGDGSSQPFVQMIEAGERLEQEATRPLLRLKRPVFYSKGEVHLVALPAEEYRISYTLHYPDVQVIRSQYLSWPVSWEGFKKEIASCRTFALYEELARLIDLGLIKGGSLDNAVVIKGESVLSKEGLRFPDEMARHKVLDLLGDLALVGGPFLAHVIAIRSGHSANTALCQILLHALQERDDA